MDNKITFTYKQLLIITLILIAIVGIVFFFNKGTSTESFDIKGTYIVEEGYRDSVYWDTSIKFLGNGLCIIGYSNNGTYTQSGNYIRVKYDDDENRKYFNFTILDEDTLKVEGYNYKFYKDK